MRFALPKGRLFDQLRDYLADRSITFRFRDDRDYRPSCSLDGFGAKLLKARVIPQMLALGNFQIGFTCTDVVRETGYDDVVILQELGLNAVTLVVAVHESKPDVVTRPPMRPLVIATEYPNIAGRWAMGKGLSHVTVDTTGSTEAYPPEDADVIVDVVETGATMEANGMIIVERLFRSCTCALSTRSALADPAYEEGVARFISLIRKD